MKDEQVIQIITEVQSKLKLRDLVSDFTNLSPTPDQKFIGGCPFENCSGNIVVHSAHDIFRCDECKRNGDIITFASEITGYEFIQSLLYLKKRVGIDRFSRL